MTKTPPLGGEANQIPGPASTVEQSTTRRRANAWGPGAALGKRMGAIALEAVMERMPELHRLHTTTDWLPSLWVRGARTLPVAY